MSRARLLRVMVAAAVLAAGCGFPGARDEIRVGAVYPTGGGQGPGGVEELRGVQLAAELAGRDSGRRIRVVESPADGADAAAAAVRSLGDRGIGIVLGSYGSTISLPAAEAADELGMLFWETGAVGEVGMRAESGERFFRVAPTGASLGRAAVEFVRGRLLPQRGGTGAGHRYGVVYVDDVYGRSIGRGAAEALREAGIEPAVEIGYRLRTADYDQVARQLAEAGVRVLVVAAYLEDGIALRQAVLRQRVELDAMIGTSSSYCMLEFGHRLGEQAVGVFASDKPDAAAVREDALDAQAAALLRRARSEYTKRFDESMTAPALAGFSAAWALFSHVLPRADTLEPDDVAAAARRADLAIGSLPNGSGLRFAGPGGSGENLEAASVIWEWVAPGVREIVWPPAFASRAPVNERP